jgi:hypothetical protein
MTDQELEALLHRTYESTNAPVRVSDDPHCLATLRNYRSLMPLAQEARKPMFHLKAADGALGGHATAALEVYKDYKRLALNLAARCQLPFIALI